MYNIIDIYYIKFIIKIFYYFVFMITFIDKKCNFNCNFIKIVYIKIKNKIIFNDTDLLLKTKL